jgi:basic membrane lipoprotein Med (substrate-binding protein (PBP1-ABC) superfamily)
LLGWRAEQRRRGGDISVKIRRLHKLIALGAVLTLALAACGGDDDDSDSSSSDTTAASSETTTGGSASGAAVTLDDECQKAKDAGVEAPEGYKVSLVTDIGRIDDGTFNQYSYDAMQSAADCFGFETSYIETTSEADYEKNIATTLDGDPDVVITNGFLITDATAAAATANPDVKFIGIDQFLETYPENMVGILFREDQGGYIAGVTAASLSESGVVGVVGGREDVPPVGRVVNAVEMGAKSVNPDITVLHVYNESFNDPNKGASDAQQFMGEGADVIFGAGGPTGSAGVKAAAEAGTWGIGVDQDEYYTTFNGGKAAGADHLVTSAVKRVDLAVFRNIVAALDGSFTGGVYTLEAKNDGITYAPFHDADIPTDVQEKIEATRAGLADGSIDTGVDPITGLPN